MRLCITSLLLGGAVSCSFTAFVWLTRAIFYFPPVWPGLFFSWAVFVVGGRHWADCFGIVELTFGNAAFYAWLSFRVLKADVVSRGRLSRYFVRCSLQNRHCTNDAGRSRNSGSGRRGRAAGCDRIEVEQPLRGSDNSSLRVRPACLGLNGAAKAAPFQDNLRDKVPVLAGTGHERHVASAASHLDSRVHSEQAFENLCPALRVTFPRFRHSLPRQR